MAVYDVEIVVSALPQTGEYLGRYLAEVPSLPGCWVEADSIDEAVAQLQEVVPLFIRSHRQRGDPLPPALDTLPAHLLPLRMRALIPVG